MLETLKNSLNVRMAYKTNSFIYSFKMIPGIGKLVPDTIYGEEAFKKIFLIFTVLFDFLFKAFLNIIFLVIAFVLNKSLFGGTVLSFVILYLFISVTMNFLMPITLYNKRDADYLVTHLKMNPKKFLLSNYIFDLIKVYIIYTPVLLIMMGKLHANLLIALVLPLINICLSLFSAGINIMLIKTKGLVTILKLLLFLIVIGTVFSYIANYETYDFTLIVTGIIVGIIVLGFLNLIYLIRYKKYNRTFKLLYAKGLQDSEFKAAELKAITSSIVYDKGVGSDKTGYEFIHDLFVKRHRKMLTDPVRIACLLLGVLIIFLCLITYYFHLEETMHKLIMNRVAYIAFIMYLVNRGDQLTKAMFMNCDCALLTYRLYRTPKVILEMFSRRLKTLFKLNLFPAFLMSLGGVAILLLTGDNNITNYALFVLTVVSMSIFFSIHYLVMYYLLQPFSDKTEVKSKAYSFINYMVYFICFIPVYEDINIPLSIMGPVIIIFTIIYSIVGLILAYKLAPKTFKIRL